MFGFLALIFFVLAGFGGIILFMVMEKKQEKPVEVEVKPPDEPQVSPQEVLGRLGLEKPQPSLPLGKAAAPDIAMPAGPTKLESELSLKYDELFSEHRELQDKYTKLEILVSEKNTALDKAEKNLGNELKNQKEFNKIKDVLEKELKEGKDKGKGLQSDVSAAQTEAKGYQSRIVQLEEKIKKLEISLLSSEGAINDAQGNTQLARKTIGELEEKLREAAHQISDKNAKIAILVEKLKDLPPGDSTVKSMEIAPPDSGLPVADVVLAPPPPATNVDEKGGAEKTKKPPSQLLLEASREEAVAPLPSAPEPTATAPEPLKMNLAEPEEKPAESQEFPEKTKSETLSLAPDILSEADEQKPAQPPNPAAPASETEPEKPAP